MRKVLSLEKLDSGFFLLEYEINFLLFKKVYIKKVFRGISNWRYLYTGNTLPFDLNIDVEKLRILKNF